MVRRCAGTVVAERTPPQLDGRVHKLSVRIKKPGMTARARRSYVAAPDKFTITDKH
jgi:hypothetical protein